MSAPFPDIGPPPPDSVDMVVGDQRLTVGIKSSPGDTKITIQFLRAGVPETRFTRREANSLAKAFLDILKR